MQYSFILFIARTRIHITVMKCCVCFLKSGSGQKRWAGNGHHNGTTAWCFLECARRRFAQAFYTHSLPRGKWFTVRCSRWIAVVCNVVLQMRRSTNRSNTRSHHKKDIQPYCCDIKRSVSDWVIKAFHEPDCSLGQTSKVLCSFSGTNFMCFQFCILYLQQLQ